MTELLNVDKPADEKVEERADNGLKTEYGTEEAYGLHGITAPRESFSYSLICFLLILLFSVMGVVGINLNTTSTTVSMHFPEISSGHNPDGSPFDIYEVMSDEVLNDAAKKLDGKIDAESLKKHLSVIGVTSSGSFEGIQQRVVDGNDKYSYFPSRYKITYSIVSDSIREEGFLASAKAVFNQITLPRKKTILKAVSDAYREYYDDTYVISDEVVTIDWEATKKLDHFNRVTELRNIINMMNRYFTKLYDEDVKFVAGNGTSFGDLTAELGRISSVDVENYESYVVQNGVTADKEKLLKQLKYVSSEYNENFSRSTAEYNVMLEGIQLYDPNVTKVVFIPSLDYDDKFYMNRTQIGIDYLTQKAEKAKLDADAAINNAAYYDYLTAQFSNAPVSDEAALEKADGMAEQIMAKIDDFSVRAAEVNKEYLTSVSYEGITVGETQHGEGLIVSAVAVAKTVVIWSALFYVLYCIYSVLKRKYKRELNTGKEDGKDVSA